MHSLLKTTSYLGLLSLATAQAASSAVPSAVPSEAAPSNTAANSVGLLSLITPAPDPAQINEDTLDDLSASVESFYDSYTQADKFNFQSAAFAILHQVPPSELSTLAGAQVTLNALYLDQDTSLLNSPTAFLSRLHTAVTPFPATFTSAVLSQASAVLLGYESIATQQLLSTKPTQPPVTPGMSIDIGQSGPTGAASGGSASAGPAATGGSGSGSGPASSSSTGAGGAPTANAMLVLNAAVGAAGVLAAALM